MSPDVADLIKRTRTDRGLPPVVTDPGVIARLAVLLRPTAAPTSKGRKAA